MNPYKTLQLTCNQRFIYLKIYAGIPRIWVFFNVDISLRQWFTAYANKIVALLFDVLFQSISWEIKENCSMILIAHTV